MGASPSFHVSLNARSLSSSPQQKATSGSSLGSGKKRVVFLCYDYNRTWFLLRVYNIQVNCSYALNKKKKRVETKRKRWLIGARLIRSECRKALCLTVDNWQLCFNFASDTSETSPANTYNGFCFGKYVGINVS